MKLIDRYIFKEHLIPFILSLLVLLFILLTNFLLKTIDKFLDKGLSVNLLFEYLFYNMAWIAALAVPMAVLIATLTAFGRFSSDNEITAMKTCGLSTSKLLRAPLLFGFIVAISMIYFNNQVLPDMNHKARSLSVNISKKRPDLEFTEGQFTEAIPNYSIYVGKREQIKDENFFFDINIFNNRPDGSSRTITADNGTVESIDDAIILHLNDGEIHEMMNSGSDYTKIEYEKYDVVVPIDNLLLRRKDLRTRGDREMTYAMMTKRIDDLDQSTSKVKRGIKDRLENEFSRILEGNKQLVESLFYQNNPKYLKSFQKRMKNLKRGVNNDIRLLKNYTNKQNKYLVELNKKFSIPVASIVFILVGAPLGVMARKGNFAISGAIGLGFFIFYWAFLIAGENFADRGIMTPLVSMWLPNIVLSILGLFLIYKTSKDRSKIKFDFLNLFFKKEGKS